MASMPAEGLPGSFRSPVSTGGSMGHRLAWGGADQAVSSLTNFVVLVVGAHELTRDAFGALALAMAVYALVLGISRALAGEPLIVRTSATPASLRAREAPAALGTGTAVGVLFAILVALLGALVGGETGTALVALAVVVPALVLQDTARCVFFAAGRPRSAFLNDTAWLAVQVLLLWLFAGNGVTAVVLAWGGAATVAAALALVQARAVPDLGAVRRWLDDHSDLWPRFTAEFVTVTGAWQVALLALGATAGLIAVGGLRAGMLLVGPLNIAFLAVPLVAVPESARLLRSGRAAPAGHAALISAVLGGVAALWGLAIALVPNSLGRDLLGGNWVAARSVLMPLTVVMVAMGVNLGALCVLRALGAARESLAARLTIAPLVVVAATVGGVASGARGAAWGWALASIVAIPVWRYQLAHAARSHAPARESAEVEWMAVVS